MTHVAVLATEAVASLRLKSDSVVIDCTLGSGGYADVILSELGPAGKYLGIDADAAAITDNQRLATTSHASVQLEHGNFRHIDVIAASAGITEADAIVADLGWRIEQFTGETNSPRGFSFQRDEPLYMTYGDPATYPFTAQDIVNDWAEEDIANVIYAYGQERYARRIAKAIVQARETQFIATSVALADIVRSAVPGSNRSRIHPATKTFQALRIAVNDEFDALAELIHTGFALLRPAGRLAIVTFHSLEDRIVKQTFKELQRDQEGVLVHKKPITPTAEERQVNPRARSAKLRTIEKL